MEKHLLAIPNRCTGCNRCTYVCAAVKEGMFTPSRARLKINNFPLEGYSVPSICFQCPKPDCLEACPEEAIYKNERGVWPSMLPGAMVAVTVWLPAPTA